MKGISPLVASVLLIAFTVSISTLIMGWFSTFARTTTSNVSSSAAEAIACNSAGVNIEHVYIVNGSNPNVTTILVHNVGFYTINVTGMVINTTGGVCSNSTPVSLAKGNYTTIQMIGCNIFPGAKAQFSRAVVTTNCGGVDDTTSDPNDVN